MLGISNLRVRRRARVLAVASFSAGALLCASASQAGADTFSNGTPLAIPGGTGTLGNASIYPSPIAVSGLSGYVQKVTVTFNGFAHQCSIDVDALLVGPQGQSSMLMSDAGDCANEQPLRPGVNLTFDDAAATSVPCLDSNSTPSMLPGGTYMPTDYSPPADGVQSVCNPSTDLDHRTPPPPDGQGPLADQFSGVSRPPGGWPHFLGTFANTDPNGTWLLYLTDQYKNSVGRMAGGWSLNIVTSPTPVTPPPPPSGPSVPNVAAKLATTGFKLKQKVLKQRGVVATFTSTEAGNLVATGKVSGARAHLNSVQTTVAANTRTTVALKVPKAGLKALKKAFTRHKKLKAKIALVLTIPSGIKTTVTKTVTLVP